MDHSKVATDSNLAINHTINDIVTYHPAPPA